VRYGSGMLVEDSLDGCDASGLASARGPAARDARPVRHQVHTVEHQSEDDDAELP